MPLKPRKREAALEKGVFRSAAVLDVSIQVHSLGMFSLYKDQWWRDSLSTRLPVVQAVDGDLGRGPLLCLPRPLTHSPFLPHCCLKCCVQLDTGWPPLPPASPGSSKQPLVIPLLSLDRVHSQLQGIPRKHVLGASLFQPRCQGLQLQVLAPQKPLSMFICSGLCPGHAASPEPHRSYIYHASLWRGVVDVARPCSSLLLQARPHCLLPTGEGHMALLTYPCPFFIFRECCCGQAWTLHHPGSVDRGPWSFLPPAPILKVLSRLLRLTRSKLHSPHPVFLP